MNKDVLSVLFKSQLADFIVREELGFELAGQGEHLWMYVEKSGANTDFIRDRIVDAFEVKRRDVNYSGKKDRYAQTSQWFSVHLPGTAPQLVDSAQARLAAQTNEAQVVQANCHLQKIRRGIHKSNWFEICLRRPNDMESAEFTNPEQAVRDRLNNLQAKGFANTFGQQRFGYELQTIDQMLEHLPHVHAATNPQVTPKKKKKPPRLTVQQEWAFSSIRSLLFNQALKQRQAELKEHWQAPQVGDVMQLAGSNSCFLWDDPQQESQESITQRIINQDLFITGPMFGKVGRGIKPQGLMDEIENQIWQNLPEKAQIALTHFQNHHRRALWCYPESFTVHHWTHADIRLSFRLGSGSYATSLLSQCFELIETSTIESNT